MTKKLTYHPLEVSNWFVDRANNYGIGVSARKTHWLMYLAQGLHLAAYNRPLIETFFRAESYGPTVPSLAVHYKSRCISCGLL